MAAVVETIKANNTPYLQEFFVETALVHVQMWIDEADHIFWYLEETRLDGTCNQVIGVTQGQGRGTIMEISHNGIFSGIPNAGSDTRFDSRRARRVFARTLRRLQREAEDSASNRS